MPYKRSAKNKGKYSYGTAYGRMRRAKFGAASKYRIQRRVVRTNMLTHYFKRKVLSSWTYSFTISAAANATGTSFFASDFKLSYLSNASDFTALFDLYRINGIKMSFHNGYNANGMTELGNTTVINQSLNLGTPILTIVSDPDDSTTPSNASDLLERPNSKTFILDQKRSFYLKPRVDREASDGGTTYNYVQMKNRPFIDMAKPDVVHNGVKTMLELPFRNTSASQFNASISLPIVTTYYLELRNPR